MSPRVRFGLLCVNKMRAEDRLLIYLLFDQFLKLLTSTAKVLKIVVVVSDFHLIQRFEI